MVFSVGKKSAAFAASAAVGMSTLFLFASPAGAVQGQCTNGGILVSPTICELTVTATGASTFTPTVQMTQLEILLVGGGANGNSNNNNTNGYGGGGGEVTVVNFDNHTVNPIALIVGAAGGGSNGDSTATQGPIVGSARGANLTSSGNGNGGVDMEGSNIGGGGGGAGASANSADGGAGIAAMSAPGAGPLFADDTTCYGGGGVGVYDNQVIGTGSCGAGYSVQGDGSVELVAPRANSGGGGAGAPSAPLSSELGASGIVVIRWNAPAPVSLSFNDLGHGAAVASQDLFVGGVAVRPADPTAAGYIFKGWYSDPQLTIPADFSAPLTASSTFYASWVQALPVVSG